MASHAPRKFTRRLKPSLKGLHLRSHISSANIDDLYLQGNTYDDCVHNVIDTVIHIDTLGLVTQLVILGFVLNSVTMIITLTQEKAQALQTACITLFNTTSPTITKLICMRLQDR